MIENVQPATPPPTQEKNSFVKDTLTHTKIRLLIDKNCALEIQNKRILIIIRTERSQSIKEEIKSVK